MTSNLHLAQDDTGPTARRSLVDTTVEAIIADIVSGKYPVGSTLPPEAPLASALGVSRLTLREAVSSLRTKSVLRVRRGSGTYVNPISRWSIVDSQLLVAKAGGDAAMPRKLIEARSIIERGVCELAAERRTDEDLDDLLLHIQAMADAARIADTEAFVRADLAFHQVIMDASGNAFLAELFAPIREVLAVARRQTSAIPQIRRNAIEHHRKILEAIRARDRIAAGETMRLHMVQTQGDFDRYVAPDGRSGGPKRSGTRGA